MSCLFFFLSLSRITNHTKKVNNPQQVKFTEGNFYRETWSYTQMT
jgi:hypothetical protein